MPAPTYSWNAIASSQTDADSPLDTTLMEGIRQNLIHLEEWLGDSYAAAKDHEHDGVSSAKVKDSNIDKIGGLFLFDDFLLDSLVGWTNVNSGAAILVAQDNGVCEVSTGTVATTYRGIAISSNKFARKSASATITFETRLKYSGTVFRECRIGMINDPTVGTNTGAYFTRNAGTGVWQAVTRLDGSGVTTTDLDVSPSTSYQKLKVVITNGDAKFYVNDVLKATHTTYLPTVNIGPAVAVANDQTDDRKSQVDYILTTLSARL